MVTNFKGISSCCRGWSCWHSKHTIHNFHKYPQGHSCTLHSRSHMPSCTDLASLIVGTAPYMLLHTLHKNSYTSPIKYNIKCQILMTKGKYNKFCLDNHSFTSFNSTKIVIETIHTTYINKY